MKSSRPVIVWFRQDLRLADNPALTAAVRSGAPVLPVYILDDDSAGEWRMGAASRWWLHHSLQSLQRELRGGMQFYRGRADEVLPEIVRRVDATSVYWNRCYEPWRIARDRSLKDRLTTSGCAVRSFNGSLLFDPPDVTKADGTPYRVFTPFYRNGCLNNAPPPREPLPKPADIVLHQIKPVVDIDGLDLLPKVAWYREMLKSWVPGEDAAMSRLREFLRSRIEDYTVGRDRPDRDFVSGLSAHLHFGEISPNQVWSAAKVRESAGNAGGNVEHFMRELGWREFSYSLLYHWPELPRENLQRKFNRFPWREDSKELRQWQRGETGYPIVDAGMRELWRTGYMHNRVRMITASFLVKNLMQHWQHGARWFWDTLADADLANNSASWQWVAGCGADAAPYFRIFNPVTQGKKFDPHGSYVRRYVPELAGIPEKFIHNPWDAPAELLGEVGVQLGNTYPARIVDLKASRERALAAFKALSSDV